MTDVEESKIEESSKPFRVFNYFEATTAYPEFTNEDINVFINTFEEYDIDGSGSISAEELTAAFKKMGQGSTPEEVAELLEMFDADKSGEIDWPEFLGMMRFFYPWKRLEYVANYVIPAQKYPEFTREDVAVFADAFREFDTDKSGTIDASELSVAFKQMGQGVTEEEVKKILKIFDADESGELDFSEFLDIMGTVFYPEKRSQYEAEFYQPVAKYPEFSRRDIDAFVFAFRMFDIDNSGAISTSELREVFKYLGQGVTEEELAALMEAFDADGSGEIEWPEFFQMMRSFYPHKRYEYLMEFYVPALAFPEFSPQDIDVFATNFRDFDLDESGSIDVEELGAAFKAMGQGVSKEGLEKIIASVDENGNGEVEWNEYLTIMRNLYPERLADFDKKWMQPAKKFTEFDRDDIMVFINTFRAFDEDGNESMDANELSKAFAYMGQGASKEKIQEIIKKADEDGNGTIEWVEFLNIMRDLYSHQAGEATATKAATPAPSAAPVKAAPSATQSPAKPAPATSQPATKPAAQPATKPAAQSPAKPAAQPAPSATQSPAKPAPSATQPASTSASATPAKSSFGAAKPTSTGAPASTFASHRANPSCPVCSKSVYPIEAIAANGTTYHKGCFKCQEPGCNIALTLSSFKGAEGKVYCQKHVPAVKHTSTTVDGSLHTATAVNAPKLAKAQGVKKNHRMTYSPSELQNLNLEEQGEKEESK